MAGYPPAHERCAVRGTAAPVCATRMPLPSLTDGERGIRQRLRADFPHYAATCLRIRSKGGAIGPLVLNKAQQHIHAQLERQKAAWL